MKNTLVCQANFTFALFLPLFPAKNVAFPHTRTRKRIFLEIPGDLWYNTRKRTLYTEFMYEGSYGNLLFPVMEVAS